MQYNTVIVGAGQLGSRYLQGLAGFSGSLIIYVIDINQSSLDVAKARWEEVAINSANHTVYFDRNFEKIPTQIDLAIISTSSNVREVVVTALSKAANVRNWIFEKVLAQNEASINNIEKLIGNKSNAWVNTFFRTVEWFKEIKKQSATGTIELEVTGGNWGIACNAIHVFDFVAWWTGETLLEIDTSKLHEWHLAKRQGFWEINGCLTASFSGGSIVTLISDESNDPFVMKIKTLSEEWQIDWENNIARKNDGSVLPGKALFQSERTKDLAMDILFRNTSELPTLQMSCKLHRLFINNMLAHWNKNRSDKSDYVPIT